MKQVQTRSAADDADQESWTWFLRSDLRNSCTTHAMYVPIGAFALDYSHILLLFSGIFADLYPT